MRSDVALIVLAKAPVPGRVKTRCTPPCTPQQAADLATAALSDTLHTALSCRVDRLVIALDGPPGPWLPQGVEVVAQGDGSLGERLDAAFRAVGQPSVLIGMDTPQVTAHLLDTALSVLRERQADAVLGPSTDGGFWCLGLADPRKDVCAEVTMSRDDTGARIRHSIARRGLTCATLPELVDVDDFATALDVAQAVPGSRFAVSVAGIAAALPAAPVGSGR